MSKENFELSKADKSRINQITSTFENLSTPVAKELLITLLSAETIEHYPRKFSWSAAENNALRLFWNRTNPDEICDGFQCSYLSLIERAKGLGLFPQDGNIVTSEHVWKAVRLMELGESVKSVAELFNLDYDFKESVEVTRETVEKLEMKQDELFGGEV